MAEGSTKRAATEARDGGRVDNDDGRNPSTFVAKKKLGLVPLILLLERMKLLSL
jgi:hypothetical protein